MFGWLRELFRGSDNSGTGIDSRVTSSDFSLEWIDGGSEAYITKTDYFRDGGMEDKYTVKGSGGEWYFYPGGSRCSTSMDAVLIVVWKKEKLKLDEG